GRCIRNHRYGCPALYAIRGVHCELLHDLWNGDRIRLYRAAGVHRDEAARLNDLVERAAIDDQIFDHREGSCAEGLDPDLVAVIELPHVELTCRRAAERTVGDAIDHHAARSADPFTTIVLEVDRVFFLFD